MKYKFLITIVSFTFILSSCNRVRIMFGGDAFSKYSVEANNNTTEKDKEAINEYNYSVLLADSILSYFNSKDSISLGRCVEKLRDKRRHAFNNVSDDYLKDLFERNFLEIDKELSNYSVPQEIIFPISLKDYIYRPVEENIICYARIIGQCELWNIGCDKSGRVYRQIHRCWRKEATKVCVPIGISTIRDNDGIYHFNFVDEAKKKLNVENKKQTNVVLKENNDYIEPYAVDDAEIYADRKYTELCDKVEREYRSNPEKFIDVSEYMDEYAFYTSRNGNEYNFAGEGNGISELGDEGVYALFNEQKFVKRK